MQIKVMFKNNRHGLVDAHSLDQLIMKGRIKKFLRSGGWVIVGRDPVRTGKRELSTKEK